MTDQPDIRKIRDSVALVGRLSDSLVRFGPFSLGIDGVLSWVPGLGEVYSAGAAAFILVQGARARVPLPTLVLCGALMGGRTVITALPFAGPAIADLVTAHRWSARIIVHAIDRRLKGVQTDARPATRAGRWATSAS